jgi:hypothetical protein
MYDFILISWKVVRRKKRLFWFCEGSAFVSGKTKMCRLCGWQKEILKNAKGGLFLYFLLLV